MDIHVLARGTPGFSGADLANLVNEAALNAARYNQKVVRMLDFEFAKDKVLMGSERRSMIINEEEKKVTAYHEAGHALLAVVLPHADPVHKVTIIPRGMALGVTMQLPVDDKHNYTRDYLNDQIAILLGGRIAEEITIGQHDDRRRQRYRARHRPRAQDGLRVGHERAMGPLTFGKKEEQIFLGREIAQHQDYSEDTAIRIDQEVKRFVTSNYERARDVLEKHRPRSIGSPKSCSRARCSTPSRCAASSPAKPLEEHRPPAASPTRDRRRRRAACGEGTAVDRAAAAAAQQADAAGITSRAQVEARITRVIGTQVEPRPSSVRRACIAVRHDCPRARFAVPLPGGRTLALGERTLVMGILNVTPDSFADGGAALRSGTRRGRRPADGRGRRRHPRRRRRIHTARAPSRCRESEELRRVLPVVERLSRQARRPVSIDTYKADVAREARRPRRGDRQRRQRAALRSGARRRRRATPARRWS